MSKQVTKPIYLNILPSDVLVLIFEFEGSAKENYNIILKEFKKILEIKNCYNLAFQILQSYDDRFYLRQIPSLHTTSTYKFILNQKKVSSFCNCKEPCCYQFHYQNDKKYICNCHEKKERGIVYYYGLNKKEKLAIRPDQTGFCVKITKSNYYNLLMTPSPQLTSKQQYDENEW